MVIVYICLLCFLTEDPKAFYMQRGFLPPSWSIAASCLQRVCWLTEHFCCVHWSSGETGKGVWRASGQGPSFGTGLKTGTDPQAPQKASWQLSEAEQPDTAVLSRTAPLQQVGMLLPWGCERHLENLYHFLQLPEGACAGVMLGVPALRQSPSQL